jgi:hypothetical protein
MRDSKNTHSSYYGNYGNLHLYVLYIHSYLTYENGLVCIMNGMCWLYVPNVLSVRIWCASRPLVIRVLAYKSWKYIE